MANQMMMGGGQFPSTVGVAQAPDLTLSRYEKSHIEFTTLTFRERV